MPDVILRPHGVRSAAPADPSPPRADPSSASRLSPGGPASRSRAGASYSPLHEVMRPLPWRRPVDWWGPGVVAVWMVAICIVSGATWLAFRVIEWMAR